MRDYRLFDISDFALDNDFIRWVTEGSEADNVFWDNWLRQHPDKYMAVAEAKRIVASFGTEDQPINDEQRENEINRLLLTVRETLHGDQGAELQSLATTKRVTRKWVWYAAAAAFIGFAYVTYYSLQKRDKKAEQFTYEVVTPSLRLIESVNTSGRTITLKLPDESIVELAPSSRIAYPNNLDSNNTRDVYLSGEAFFKVTKNPARPFRVFANEIVTNVLGTSFTVRSFETDTVIQVTVRTGKVRVYSQTADTKEENSSNHAGGIILTPNQELVYKKLEQKFRKNLLENPIEIVSETVDQKNMLYEEAPLEKVFGQLGKIYGINIVYDNELLRKCTVTADLRNEPFYRKLELICKAIGASYEVIDGQIVIQTKGCDL